MTVFSIHISQKEYLIRGTIVCTGTGGKDILGEIYEGKLVNYNGLSDKK